MASTEPGSSRRALVEGAAGFEDVHLTAQAVARVLQVRDAEAGPGGRVVGVLPDDAGEYLAGAVEVVQRAGARDEGREHGAGLQVLLREGLIERDAARRGRGVARGVCGGDGILQIAEAL